MRFAGRLLHCTKAGSSAEFALVLPLLIVLLFAVIDGGRFIWEYNRAEKATQMGVRFAAVAGPALNGLDNSYSFAIDGGVTQGTSVPTANFDSATCTNTSCTCSSTTGTFCGSTSFNSTNFQRIVQRMQYIYPQIGPTNVRVIYKNIGLGFSGNPDGSDISPLVTVKLKGLSFRPITCLVLPCSLNMPSFTAALTAEDLSGQESN